MQNALFEQRLENLKTVIDSNNQALLITNEKNIVLATYFADCVRRLFACN